MRRSGRHSLPDTRSAPIHRTAALVLVGLAAALATAAGCRDKKVPREKVQFIGTWVGAKGSRLDIRQNGTCDFSGKVGATAYAITGGRVTFKGERLTCKGKRTVTLDIGLEPSRQKGQWVMRLSGELYGRGAAPEGFPDSTTLKPRPTGPRIRPRRRPPPRRVAVPPAPHKAPIPKVAAGTVTFQTLRLKAGLERTGTVTSNTWFVVEGKAHHRTRKDQVRLRLEMVRNNNPIRTEVTWLAQQSTATVGNRKRTEVGPLQGKTFIMETRIGKLDIWDPAGHPVLGRLGRVAVREADRIRRPSQVTEVLPRTPLKPGEELEGLATLLAKTERNRWDRPPVQRVSWSRAKCFVVGLAKVDGIQVAVLRVEAPLAMKRQPATPLRLHLSGWMAVAIDGARLVRFVLGGPIQVADRKNAGWTLYDAHYHYQTKKPR